MGEWDYGTAGTCNTSNAITYTLKGPDWGDLYNVRPAREGEHESALQWLDRRVSEICVKL